MTKYIVEVDDSTEEALAEFLKCKPIKSIAGYKESAQKWIPVSERMPEDSYETDLIVTTGSGMVKLACFTKEDGFVSLTGFHRISEVIAWMELELPKPYTYRG